jgi:hypothetical protein
MLTCCLRLLELLLGRKKCAPEPTAAKRIVRQLPSWPLLEEDVHLSISYCVCPSIQEVAATKRLTIPYSSAFR